MAAISDYEKVANRLHVMTNEQFHSFIWKFLKEDQRFDKDDAFLPGVDDNSEANSPWRLWHTDALLNYREENPSEWRKLCHHFGIQTDEARKLDAEIRNLSVVKWAAIVAAVLSAATLVMRVVEWWF